MIQISVKRKRFSTFQQNLLCEKLRLFHVFLEFKNNENNTTITIEQYESIEDIFQGFKNVK